MNINAELDYWLGDSDDDDDPVRLVRCSEILHMRLVKSQSMTVEVGSWENCPMQLTDGEPGFGELD